MKKKNSNQPQKTIRLSYRTDRLLIVFFIFCLTIGLILIGWSEDGSIVWGMIGYIMYIVPLVVAITMFLIQLLRLPVIEIEKDRITSYKLFNRKLCSVDLTKPVYYNYHRFEEYVELKISNYDFSDDACSPRHSSSRYLNSPSEVYVTCTDEIVSRFPKEDWVHVKGGIEFKDLKERDKSRKIGKILHWILGSLLIIISLGVLIGSLYFAPFQYYRSTTGYIPDQLTTETYEISDRDYAQFDTVYFDEEDTLVAWTREIRLTDDAKHMTAKEFYEQDFPGITDYPYVTTEEYQEANMMSYVIHITNLDNSSVGWSLSKRSFTWIEYDEGTAYASNSFELLKEEGSHKLKKAEMDKMKLHTMTMEEANNHSPQTNTDKT